MQNSPPKLTPAAAAADGGNGGDNNNTDANKENNGNRKKRKNYGTWTPSIKFDKEWDGGKKGWFKYEQRQHKYKTDNALKKSDFSAWEKQKRAEMEKMIELGKPNRMNRDIGS